MTSDVAIWIGLLACALAAPAAAEELAARPWEPSYKLRPDQTDRLTPADVVGPDGIVYPDWRHAGIPGGIPAVAVRARIEDFGGKPDDDRDDSDALTSGARAVARAGGGALLLGKGTYHLDRPVILTDDGVVIRGAGMAETKIVFRYGLDKGQVRFGSLAPGAAIGPDTYFDVQAHPEGLKRLAVTAGGKVVAERKRGAHWGGTFRLVIGGWRVVKAVGAGRQVIHAVAEWDGGRRQEASVTVNVDPKRYLGPGRRRFPRGDLGAISFCGDGASGQVWKLAADGKRGDTEIVLTAAKGLRPGDALVLNAPATDRWNRLVRNACRWGNYRTYPFRVEAVSGGRVRLNQPLRYGFPTIDAATARKVHPIRRCGVEDLTIVQTRKLWTCGVLFADAWECWARGVKVVKAGRFPIHASGAKWCEIRDCTMEDAWYHGGGGTAYVGWQQCCDCLMENVTTRKMRHAPCVQWAAGGNVIRRSSFFGSDMQWHAGWCSENLFEQCVVDAGGRWGSYGYGAWASPPEDAAHGPQGPRNVVYNCDIRSGRTGLWMGGMNENWLILHNRFTVGRGPAVYAKTCSFDHIIRGNVFVLRDAKSPGIVLATPDCVGVEIVANRMFGGGGKVVAGKGKALVERGNTASPPADDPPRPSPKVPSIFQWQRRQAAKGR